MRDQRGVNDMSEKMMEQIEKYDLESAMNRLDEVAQKLSSESIGLDESLALYEEGVALVRYCTAKLESVERKINVLRLGADGEVSEQPFDTSAL